MPLVLWVKQEPRTLKTHFTEEGVITYNILCAVNHRPVSLTAARGVSKTALPAPLLRPLRLSAALHLLPCPGHC